MVNKISLFVFICLRKKKRQQNNVGNIHFYVYLGPLSLGPGDKGELLDAFTVKGRASRSLKIGLIPEAQSNVCVCNPSEVG